MAQPGRKPKPVAQKKAEGNPGKRSLATLVPPPKQGDMMCPNSVASNPRAKGYWDMFIDNAAPGHLAPIDAPMLARLCVALAFADEATEYVMSRGLLVKSGIEGSPYPIQNPYLAIVNKQTMIAKGLASELALPPAQRNRMGGNDGEGGGGATGWDAL